MLTNTSTQKLSLEAVTWAACKPTVASARNVLVSGPQRSGTTFAAHVVSADCGLTYVDEEDYLFLGFDEARMRERLKRETGCVYHCPGLSPVLHRFSDLKGLVVLFCVRPLHDVWSSQRRIGWKHDGEEVQRMMSAVQTDSPGFLDVMEDLRLLGSAAMKHVWWDSFQRLAFRNDNAFALSYEAMQTHPLYVRKELREGFLPRQWSL